MVKSIQMILCTVVVTWAIATRAEVTQGVHDELTNGDLTPTTGLVAEDGVCEGQDCVHANGDAGEVIDLLSYYFKAHPAADTKYIGQWEGDQRSGHGLEESAVGTYQGPFANGVREGLGEFSWAASAQGPAASYKGFWSDGEMDGVGALTFENGDRFFGMWSKGEKAGEGFYLEESELDRVIDGTDGAVQMKAAVCVYDDGSSYTGQIWAPYRVSSEITAMRKSAEKIDPVDTVDGECHWVPGCDGSSFEFVKPHGRGVFHYANGDRFAGGWEHGRPHGKGMLITSDGSVEYGTWDTGHKVEAIGLE